MSRTAIIVDRPKLEAAMAEAEKDGPMKNLLALWNRAAEIYNASSGTNPISFSVVMLRQQEWGTPIKTQAGRKGRPPKDTSATPNPTPAPVAKPVAKVVKPIVEDEDEVEEIDGYEIEEPVGETLAESDPELTPQDHARRVLSYGPKRAMALLRCKAGWAHVDWKLVEDELTKSGDITSPVEQRPVAVVEDNDELA